MRGKAEPRSGFYTIPRYNSRIRASVRYLLNAAVFTSYFIAVTPAAANPEDGIVVAGSATINRTSATRLDIQQTTNKAIIDWRSFSIAPNEHTHFDQNSASAVALNRVTGDVSSQILGKLTADGQIMLINPNGILFGPDSRVDVAGLVATTADIRNEDFLAGNYHFDIAGNPQASIVNQGEISIADQGLLAFVAPGVVNSGVINARLGRVSLAAGNRFMLDLYGDQLVQLAVDDEIATQVFGADGQQLDSLIENSGVIAADGGRIALTAQAARQVVDNVINTSGIIRARSAGVENGEIVLYGGNNGKVVIAGTLDVSGDSGGGRIDIKGEQIQTTKDSVFMADAADTGNGGSIVAYADEAGDYNGSFSARGGVNGGDGGFIETSGKRVRIGDEIHVDTSAPRGKIGQWSIDPDILDIEAGAGGSLPLPLTGTSIIGADTVVSALKTTSVTLQASNTINVNAAINYTGANNGNTLSFNDQDGGGLVLNLKADISLASSQHLTGQATTVNVSGSGQIQDGIDVAASGATVNVAAGTYTQSTTLGIAKSLTLSGVGRDDVIIDARTIGNKYGISVSANDVSLNNFTVYGSANFTPSAYGIKVSPGGPATSRLTNFSVNNVRSRGAGKAELDLNGVNGATITNFIADGAPVGNDAATTQGAGIQLTDTGNVTISNSTTRNNAWGGVALYQANRSYDQQTGNITIAANNNFMESNPLYAQDESASNNFGTLILNGYQYTVQNDTFISDGSGYTYFQSNASNAVNFALAFSTAEDSIVRRNNSATYIDTDGDVNLDANGNFIVGANAMGSMSLQTAINAAVTGNTIDVRTGNYNENITLNKSLGFTFSNTTLSSLVSTQGTTTALSGQLSTNSLNFAGATRLSGNTTVNTSAANGNITFAGAINGTTANAQNLTLNAGQGTVSLNDVGQTVALGDLTVTAGDYDASAGTTNVVNLTVNGRNISVGNNTVNALGNVLLNGSNIFGTINAPFVVITATNNVNTTITATNSAAISGNIVQARVTAPNTDISATQFLHLDAAINNLNVFSGGTADISGSVGRINLTPGSRLVSFNGAPVSSQSNSGLDRNGGLLQPERNALSAPLMLTTLTPGEVAFGNNVGDVFASNFSLGLSLGKLTALPLHEDMSSEENEDLQRFLYDFWGYYFSQ